MNLIDIERKWQSIWEEKAIYNITENSGPKYYVLEMLPYPSGKVHVGHLRNYSIGDVIARYMKAKGYNVLHPMGWDAFGLPAENAAINNNTHPAKWTYDNIRNMHSQLKSIGLSYNWDREITTCDPEYYKHEQKFFLELLQHNLAYQKESLVNWDPIDQTVLANEQVIDGRGWRSGAIVEKKNLKQWFLKITNYAEELLSDLETLTGWPENVRLMQEKWIGKSAGANIKFNITDSDENIEIFTTRPETLFGASFIAIAYNHPIIEKAVQKTSEITDFIKKCSQMSTATADIEKADKDGILTGLFVRHPFDNKIQLPIYIANFVLMEYGTGAIFGCPAHDLRDHQFASLMKLPIKNVIIPERNIELDIKNEPYIGDGFLTNSDFLDGLGVAEAREKALQKLEEINLGTKKVNFRLKDWGISRQRFWGCPIPIIYCSKCGIVPVPEEDLPVELPNEVSFDKTGNPLEHHPTWKHTTCPKCNAPSLRETDTFDTFFESSWYFTRYCNNKYSEMTDKEACDYWLPVDQYIGGIEHAVLHLLYARFFNKVMCDLGYISAREPFKNLLNQGMVLHQTFQNENGEWVYPEEVIKEGDKYFHSLTKAPITVGRLEKMSKSKKNLVALDDILSSFGADIARMFVLSDSPPEKDLEWTSYGVEGCARFLTKLFNMHEAVKSFKDKELNLEKNSLNLLSNIHSTIKYVTEDIEKFRLNKAIARLRELYNNLSEAILENSDNKKTIYFGFETLVRLFNPFIPHLTEEIWEKLGNKVILAETNWPLYEEKYLQSSFNTIAIQVNGKLRATHDFTIDATEQEMKDISLSMDKIVKFIEGKEIKKIIIIPNKVINIVVI